MSPEYMTIRQMCDLFDVTPRTLRFYESKELIAPLRDGQKRLFRPADRRRLRTILRAKRFGFSLEEIRELLKDGVPPRQRRLERIVRAADAQLGTLRQQRDDLEATIADLERQIETRRLRLN